MREELNALRRGMKVRGIDAYMVPTTDFHGSEYVNEYFKCREYLSGFTGSAGTLLVTESWAGLWTDGRYFLQAADQLSGSGIELMKEREPGVPTIAEWLEQNLPAGSCLGFDGRVVNFRTGEDFSAKYTLCTDCDLTGEIWEKRPALAASRIYPLPLSATGESAESKLTRLRMAMEEKGADYHLITRLEQIAWLYNLRGEDVANTPVFFAFALIDGEKDRLYVLDETFMEGEAAGNLPESTEILPYFQVFSDLEKLPDGKILLSKAGTSYAMVRALPQQVEILDDTDPCEKMKAVKNAVEIECTRHAHEKDGAAMVRFLYRLKKAMAEGRSMTELDAVELAEQCRNEEDGYLQPSFDTIAGYGSNGAIVHYSASPETNKELKPEGFLLVDSGGQYTDGTTDITRTIALGTLTEEMKTHYTLVLKSHIALASVRAEEGITGAELDRTARSPLHERGLDFNHGTGHGVGHLLSVHEGPNTISPRAGISRFYPGMITSDEPGLYFEGKYGIRLENEILCVQAGDGMLEFQPITWCPWEREAIDKTMLSTEEIRWVDNYHSDIRRILLPMLDEETGQWLKEMTAPL